MELIKLLKTHDWYYMMSEDRRAYEAGRKEAAEIMNQIRNYTKEEVLSQIEDEGLKSLILQRYYH